MPPVLRELFRMPAITDTVDAQLSPEFKTLVVFNPISVPIYFRFDTSAPVVPGSGLGPGGKAFDVACPGSAAFAWPIPDGATHLTALLDATAIVASDTDQQATISVSPERYPPSTSVLA